MQHLRFIACALALTTLNSCVRIYNQNHLLAKHELRNSNPLKLTGYYYTARKSDNIIKVEPIVLYGNGSLQIHPPFSGYPENTTFNYQSACYLKEENSLKNALKYTDCYFTFNSITSNHMHGKSQVWSQGIYKVDKNNNITIQWYQNHLGDYYLEEWQGIVINNSSFVINRTKNYRDNRFILLDEPRVYHFKPINSLPKSENYILNQLL